MEIRIFVNMETGLLEQTTQTKIIQKKQKKYHEIRKLIEDIID